jgi:non-specific protein-tyrosine kinase
VELRRYLHLLWNWFWLLCLATLLTAVSALILTGFIAPAYQATTTLLINQGVSTNNSSDYDSVERVGRTYAQMLRSDPVLTEIIGKLHLAPDLNALAKRINATFVKDTQLITLTADDSSPATAASLANQIVSEFQQQLQNLQAHRYDSSKETLLSQLAKVQDTLNNTQAQLDALSSQNPAEMNGRIATSKSELEAALAQARAKSNALLKSLDDLALLESHNTGNVVVVAEARPENSPKIRPNSSLNTIIGAIFGFLSALGFVLARDHLRNTVKSVEEVTESCNLALLGLVGIIKGRAKDKRLVTARRPESAEAEFFRLVQTNIEFTTINYDNQVNRTLLVTSACQGDGKTLVLINLGIAMAQMGKKVVLVDTDLRKPSLHTYFALSNNHGITELLTNCSLQPGSYLLPTGIDNLLVLPGGLVNHSPALLLSSGSMIGLIAELKLQADLILFDSPPVLEFVDVSLLARCCDATLLVVRAGATQATMLKKAVQQLAQVDARVSGFIFNAVPAHLAGYSYNQHRHKSWLSGQPLLREGKGKSKNLSTDLLATKSAKPTTSPVLPYDISPAKEVVETTNIVQINTPGNIPDKAVVAPAVENSYSPPPDLAQVETEENSAENTLYKSSASHQKNLRQGKRSRKKEGVENATIAVNNNN